MNVYQWQRVTSIPLTQQARVRSPVESVFLLSVFRVFPHCKTNVEKMQATYILSFPVICLTVEKKTPARLVGTGIRSRDLRNASLVRYHGATSSNKLVLFYLILNLTTRSISTTVGSRSTYSQFQIKQFFNKLIHLCTYIYLLSSDIRSEGSIAIVKKFDFDFL